jgi:hypothetical protein
LKIKNLIQKGGIPNTLPLSLLAIDKSYFGMLVLLQLCNPQGVALFSFVIIPQRVPHPFAGVNVYDTSMTHAERLRVVGCGLKGKLVRQLSMDSYVEPQSNWDACHKMMFCIARRIASKQIAAVRNKAAKEAEEMCALGQCAAALIPLQKAIDMGHLPSRALMAWLLIDGREGIAKDQNRAFQLVEEGARLGCHHCQGVLAYCYYGGYGCDINVEQSLKLAHESSDKGSKYGHYTLGKLYSNVGDKAVEFFQRAVVQNFDGAQLFLGLWHTDHAHIEGYSHAEAQRLFHLAAAQGNPSALYWLGLSYQTGQGVPKDSKEAIRWYRRAQAAGHKTAHYHLSELGA